MCGREAKILLTTGDRVSGEAAKKAAYLGLVQSITPMANRQDKSLVLVSKPVARKVDNPRAIVRRLKSKAEDVEELELRGYTLGQTLGEGTYGKVKQATSKRLHGKRVAVKIVNQKKAPDDFRKKFLPREIDILKQINHPNIIKLHEVFNVGSKVCLSQRSLNEKFL